MYWPKGACLERNQLEQQLAGLLFTPEATAWSVANRHIAEIDMEQKKLWELFQTYDYKG